MPLKQKTVKQPNPSIFNAYRYRLPIPVKEILLFDSGNSYPICPRCNSTIDREYMNFCDRCGQRLGWDFFYLAKTVHAPHKKV